MRHTKESIKWMIDWLTHWITNLIVIIRLHPSHPPPCGPGSENTDFVPRASSWLILERVEAREKNDFGPWGLNMAAVWWKPIVACYTWLSLSSVSRFRKLHRAHSDVSLQAPHGVLHYPSVYTLCISGHAQLDRILDATGWQRKSVNSGYNHYSDHRVLTRLHERYATEGTFAHNHDGLEPFSIQINRQYST